MAGDWIKWVKGLANRREVVVIATKLNRDRHEIAGRLMVLWEWTDDNVPDDDIDDETQDVSLCLGDRPFDFIDALVGLPGFADVLASPEVCWLTARSGGRLTFPKFGRHNGTTAKSRALDARKKQRQRAMSSRLCPDSNGTKSGPEKRRDISNRTEAAEGGFSSLPKTAVRQPSTLLVWFRECATSVGLCPPDVRHVIAAAVRIGTMSDAKNHAALLVDAIKTRRWHVIEPEHYAQADAWLAKHGGPE